MVDTVEQRLAGHPFFEGIDSQHLRSIAGYASDVRFEPGQTIFREGEEANRFYLIRSGRVALEVFSLEPGPLTIQTLSDGDALGWSWLIAPYRWRFDGRAVDAVDAVALDGAGLRARCEADHDLGYELLTRAAHVLERRLQATRLQLVERMGGKR